MFIPCSDHIKRLEMLGKKISPETMMQERHDIDLIVERFGKVSIDKLQVNDVTNYLMSLTDKSGSWKNSYIETLGQIYTEVPWHCNKTILKPDFPRFARNSKKADIFTTEELNALFTPEVWCGRKEYLETVFSRALKTAGVEKDGRKLVPHSLRFTYVTRMRRNLEADTVKQLAGHSSVEMTDYYTRAAIPEMVKSLQIALPSANNLFN
jgi:hypothetical protein